jgi:hypothetical protein
MEKLPFAKRRAARLAVVQVVVVMTALVALTDVALRGAAAADVGLVIWGLALVSIPYARWRAGERVRRRWNAFELSIGPTNMRCAARGSGRITMRLDEIAAITEGARGLEVRSSQPGVVIQIPRAVEGFVDVRARLARLRALTPRPDAFGWCAGLVALGLLLAATARIWDHGASLGFAVLVCQAAAATALAFDVWSHPHLARARKLAALASLALAVALPLGALVVRDLTR